MNYLLDKKSFFSSNDRAKKKAGAKPALLLAALVLGLTLGGSHVLKIMYGPVSTGLAPILGASETAAAGLSDRVGWLQPKLKLVAVNNELRAELAEAALSLSEMTARLEELRALEEELGRLGETGSPDGVVAKIMARAGYLAYDTFTLDRGHKNAGDQPIALGQLVLAGDNVILGEIVQIAGRSSKARLYSSAGRKNRVTVGEDNVPAVAEGLGGGNYIIILPVTTAVMEHDLVRLSAGGREYLLGTVGEIIKIEQEPFQRIYIRAPINIYEIRFVTITAG